MRNLHSRSIRLHQPVAVDWSNAVETKLLASDGAADDSFGMPVAISDDGNAVIVGARLDDDNGSGSGSAYVYRWNGTSWDETKLIASDGAASDQFGFSVSMAGDGNSVVIGSPWDDDNGTESGSAYVYRWNGTSWDETKLIASDGAAGDYFGVSTSISADGDIIMVGAYRHNLPVNGAGAVYVYRRNGTSWDETKLTASDYAIGDEFGRSISMSNDGNIAIVGATQDDDNGAGSGSAYIYRWNGSSWDESKLLASDGAADDQFGVAVSISDDGNTALVGAWWSDYDGLSNSGAAYAYRWNGTSWDETKLLSSPPGFGYWFGYSVSVAGDGNTIAVGSRQDDAVADKAGAAYIYEWNGTSWDETRLLASDGAANDEFGVSVAVSGDGNTAIVGAFADDDNGSNSGSAYIYRA